MIRMIGAAFLAGGSAMLGICAVRHLNRRVNDLHFLTVGLQLMIRELEYRLTPLPELLCQAAEQTGGRTAVFFDLCARGAEHLNGRTFREVWSQAAEAAQLRLEQSDLAVIEQLGSVLGRYDGESQRQALLAAVTRLERQYTDAVEQSKRLGRVYSVLGLTAGAFLIILLV